MTSKLILTFMLISSIAVIVNACAGGKATVKSMSSSESMDDPSGSDTDSASSEMSGGGGGGSEVVVVEGDGMATGMAMGDGTTMAMGGMM